MSDGRQPPERRAPPAAPGARPAGAPPAPGARAMSAARATPLAPAGPPPPLPQRLRAGAVNAGLNALALGREAVEDFRRRDRYFKFKALIVAAWLALSVTGITVACPGGSMSGGDMGARLVVN